MQGSFCKNNEFPCVRQHNVKQWNNGWFYRHLEFGLVDTSGMTEQQRREIPYTVVQSQSSVQQCTLQSSNSRLDDADSSSLPRYDDLKMACNIQSHPPQLEDETGSVVIVWNFSHCMRCFFFFFFFNLLRACTWSTLSMPPIIYLKHDRSLINRWD